MIIFFNLVTFVVASNGGHLKCLLCYQAFYQIQHLRHQCCQYGTYSYWWIYENFDIKMILIPHFFTLSLTISTLHFTIPYGFGAAARFDSISENSYNIIFIFSCVYCLMFIFVLKYSCFEWIGSWESSTSSNGSSGSNASCSNRDSSVKHKYVRKQTYIRKSIQQWKASCGLYCFYDSSSMSVYYHRQLTSRHLWLVSSVW